ncbi:hypothetical protein BDN71DRAFT_1457617 [Pleurotus eryngii]|uniref:Zn(2)-C6 fungal-type domain-containing protein n=1 Tax=Pleurotus eryngii TaxID=5323 RepID=A0A9P5ZJF9_PLEER|nr:hypothetical protein BDN71DRAFT_1457617 [Pleurotus eryngii]
MADSQIYARQLLVKRHGYPLWIPEPYGHSPIYRTKGVRIGDVGYVTQDGGFETLFNIRASPNDPINRRGVPDGFQEVHLHVHDVVHLPNFHHSNSAVTSTSAKQRSLDAGVSVTQAQTIVGAGAALEYVWSSTEGAILHLPKGASRITATKSVFREQAMRHAKNWYKFAFECSDVANGSLYLITGCDKTSSWMVGAFSDCSSGSQAILQLSVAGLLEGQLSYNYSWATSSPAIQRVGPSVDQTTAWDEDPDALERDNDIFATDAPQGNNQCAFIRGYKITLRRDVLRRILGGPTTTTQISSIEDATEGDIQRNSFSSAAQSPAWYSKGNTRAVGDGRDSGGEWDEELGDDSPSDEGDIRLEELPAPCEDCHPSALINNFMSEKYPNAEVAITHDDDWIGLIDEDDRSWPTDDELLLRLRHRYSFKHSQDAVSPDPIQPYNGSKRSISTTTPLADNGERAKKRARTTPQGRDAAASQKHRRPPCHSCQKKKMRCEFDWDTGPCKTCLRNELDCVPWIRKSNAQDDSFPQTEHRARRRSVSQEL